VILIWGLYLIVVCLILSIDKEYNENEKGKNRIQKLDANIKEINQFRTYGKEFIEPDSNINDSLKK
jgi:hypothetical protein